MQTFIKALFILLGFAIISSVNASDSGLLLGLRTGTSYDVSANLSGEKTFIGSQQPSAYRTFWIRARDGQVELAAERTNLFVPRDDGFWRVDIKHSTYNDFVEDFIWINPAPDFDALPNPFLAEQEGINAFDISLLIKEQGIDTTLGEHCQGHTSRDILFLGNQYLSVGYTRSENCRGFMMSSSKDSALQMLSLEKLESVDITTLLEAKKSKFFEEAAKNYKNQNHDNQSWGDVSGGIVRHQGQWVIKGHFPINEEGYTHFDVPITAPKTLVLYDKLYPDWNTIKQHVPDAIDAFSSPAKDMLVVLTESNSLLAFTLEANQISQQPALHILFKQPVATVMARWAEGQYVSNWTTEIQNLGPTPQQSWFTKAVIPGVDNAHRMIGVVVTSNTTLNIRQGIGKHTKPIAKVKKGSKVKVLDVLGQWCQVELNNGLIGYAHSDYVKILPKLPYVQSACPVENCRYGQWKLNQPITLYAEPSFKADALALLKAKQMVQALEGEIHTSQFGEIEVIKAKQKLIDDNQKLILHKEDKLFDLEAVGLGMHVVWYNGELYYLNNGWNSDKVNEDARWGTQIAERKTDWWVKITVPEENLSGWIVNPKVDGIGHFN